MQKDVVTIKAPRLATISNLNGQVKQDTIKTLGFLVCS